MTYISVLQFAEEDKEPTPAAAPKKDKVPYDQTIVNVDNEQRLIVVRASGGSTTVALGPNSLAADVAIAAFGIEDLPSWAGMLGEQLLGSLQPSCQRNIP